MIFRVFTRPEDPEARKHSRSLEEIAGAAVELLDEAVKRHEVAARELGEAANKLKHEINAATQRVKNENDIT